MEVFGSSPGDPSMQPGSGIVASMDPSVIWPLTPSSIPPRQLHGSLLLFQTSVLWEESPHTPCALPCPPCSIAAITRHLLPVHLLLSPLERKRQGDRALPLLPLRFPGVWDRAWHGVPACYQ